jgi:D-3-phosphoglycerate dehydrogenase
MAVLDKWKNPSDWGKPGIVAYCGRRGGQIDPRTAKVLSDAGITPVMTSIRDENGKVPDEVANADMVVLQGPGGTGEAFEMFRRARFVFRPYVGYDDIDVDAANEHGILVANVPDTFIIEVADHAMMLILSVIRKTREMDRLVRSGEWAGGANARQLASPMRRLGTMTLGLLGFGNIARMVAERAKPFGFTIIAHDPFIPQEVADQLGVKLVSIEELFQQSDVVSVHTFLNKDTRGLVSARLLGMMKPSAYIVNTARGPIIDEAALIKVLQEGKIAGAGLDVMEVEPLPADSPLNSLDNVILAPHLASFSDEGVHLHQLRVAKIILDVYNGKMPERKIVINKSLYDELAAQPELANVEKA